MVLFLSVLGFIATIVSLLVSMRRVKRRKKKGTTVYEFERITVIAVYTRKSSKRKH